MSADDTSSAGARFSRRRALGLGASALAIGWGTSLTAWTRPSAARGRLPVGGRVSLHVPFGMTAFDPHRIDDPLSAIFASSLFDALYTREGPNVVPALAENDPEPDGDGLSIRLRHGVVTAEGRPIDARDVVQSLMRAKRLGARAWLSEVGTIERKSSDHIRFSTRDPAKLVQLLCSPLTAIVPLAFDPERPDGTGAFHAQRRSDGWALTRNLRAARGPSFLDEIVVHEAPDLAASLRAFEAGADDIGWLGAGLHAPRAGAKNFDSGGAAWIVLRLGQGAGSWDSAGVVQRVLDGISPSKLTYLGLGPAWRQERDDGWGGPSGDLLVRDDAPYLIEVARTLAALLSRPGHELTPKAVPTREIETRRSRRDHLLLLDVVRPLGPGALAAWISLASSDDAAAAREGMRRPPRITDAPVRTLTRTLRVGVVGELRVQGARIPELTIPYGEAGWDLSSATRARRPS